MCCSCFPLLYSHISQSQLNCSTIHHNAQNYDQGIVTYIKMHILFHVKMTEQKVLNLKIIWSKDEVMIKSPLMTKYKYWMDTKNTKQIKIICHRPNTTKNKNTWKYRMLFCCRYIHGWLACTKKVSYL